MPRPPRMTGIASLGIIGKALRIDAKIDGLNEPYREFAHQTRILLSADYYRKKGHHNIADKLEKAIIRGQPGRKKEAWTDALEEKLLVQVSDSYLHNPRTLVAICRQLARTTFKGVAGANGKQITAEALRNTFRRTLKLQTGENWTELKKYIDGLR